MLGVWGIFGLRDHVENPTQGHLPKALARIFAAGALFALPIMSEAVLNTIGNQALAVDSDAVANQLSGALGGLSGLVPTMNFNNILANIRDAVDEVPGLIAAFAYVLGLVLVVSGILKAKEHVETAGTANEVKLKESVIRFLVAGALFGLPTVYNAMFGTVNGSGLGLLGNLSALLSGLGFLFSSYAGTACNPIAGGVAGVLGTSSFGQSLCNILLHTGAFPAFLTAVGYVIGLVMGVWGILKIRDHVLNPQQTSLWEGVSRLLAGGFFFALPIVVEVARATIAPGNLAGAASLPTTGFNDGGGFLAGLIASIMGGGACPAAPPGGGGGLGLDGVLVCFMNDIFGPLHVVLNFFAFCAGMVLLMIGVSRLIKSAQDGARGPGGIGTIMTFVAGGALISYNEMVRAFSTTLFGAPVTRTFAQMQYSICGGAGGCAEEAAAHATISAVLQFVIIVGLISFVRGIFIVRSVAEGNQQASIMAGMTHIVGGAVAVNLGPLLNAVQTTLGLGNFGIAFG